MNDADICRKYVLPKLSAAAWSDEQINEQRTFMDGQIVIAGKASPGGVGCSRTLGITALERIPVPLPSIDAQREFCDFLAEIAHLRKLQFEVEAGLDALLPSVFFKTFAREL